ncbi:MAG: enoyl-CoA hydratase/isomerase family protein [Dehalococcoidia bacterium]
MAFETILYDKKDRVATITLNRPQVLNAFVSAMGAEMLQAFHQAEGDQDVGCIILTGAGRGFCSGADLRESQANIERGAPGSFLPRSESLCQAMFNLKKPTIAAINGPAVGVGLTMTLPCDIRIASDKARFGALFVRVGLIPEFGSTFLLPRLVGLAKAKELCLLGRIIDAQEALEIGLVSKVVPHDELMAEATSLATALAEGPTFTLGLIKEALHQGLVSDLAGAEAAETELLARCRRSPEHAEGVKAFLEKRQPQFH